MQLTSFGAAQTVTGSKHLLEIADGTRLLLDCGLYQEDQENSRPYNEHFGFDPSTIDHLILSHAHIDHSGLIAKLINEGYKGKVYCTPPTFDLCKILLEDSGKIQEFETEDLNKLRRKEGKEPLAPLYTRQQAIKCLSQFSTVSFHQPIQITSNITLQFFPNSHLLGSALVQLTVEENGITHQLCFTGDVGRNNDVLMPPRDTFPQADTIICESTYGDRRHKDTDNTKQQLLDIITHTCNKKGGKLLIPAFSVGRTQKLLYLLQQFYQSGQLPDIQIYVDSPLAIKATEIYADHINHLSEEVQQFSTSYNDPFRFKPVHMLKKPEHSKELNHNPKPSIIIAGAGMMHAGRIIHHMAHHIADPKNTLLIVGFCAEGTRGRKLMQRPDHVSLFDKSFTVNADIEEIKGFSGHADYEEMKEYLSVSNPSQVSNLFLVHGNKSVFPFYKKQLQKLGFSNIITAQQGKAYQL